MFQEIYHSSSNELKLAFLDALLKKDEALQSKFVEYCKNYSTATEEEAAHSIIEEEKAELKEQLESLDFIDIEWEFEEYNPHMPEYEVRDQIAEKKVAEEFDIFGAGLKGNLEKGQVDRCYLAMAGAYEACMEAKLQDAPEAEMMEPFWLLDLLKDQWHQAKDQLDQSLITPYHFQRIINGLFERHFYHYPSENKIVHNEDSTFMLTIDRQPFLYFFDNLLLPILDNKEKAGQLEELANHWQIPYNIIPRLTLKMRKHQENHEKWESTAQSLFLEDKEVARELLEYYEKSAPENFQRVAHQVWELSDFKDKFAEYFYQTLSYEDSPQLYRSITHYLTDKNRSKDYYLALRNMFTQQDLEAFINEHQRDNKFFVMMMRVEEEYDKILKFIEKNLNSWDFNAMIRLIADVKPAESFKLIQRKIRNTLENERGRNVYENLTDLLKFAYNIEGHYDKALELAKEMYNWQPRLPALRKMMKAENLI